MTDKHYVDAEKLLEWAKVGLGSAKLYTKLAGEIESGRIDPDPPQQPVIQVGERNWQEDMNGCAGLPPTPWAWFSTEEAEWIEDSNQEIVIGSEDEYIFDDLLGPNVRKEAFMRFMINAPEALPYWLQQYAELQREYERFQQVAKGWNDDFQELETKWTEAKAETARIKKTIEGLKMLYKATRMTEENTP